LATLGFGIYYFYFLLNEKGLKKNLEIIDIYESKKCFNDFAGIIKAVESAKSYINDSYELFHTPNLVLAISGLAYVLIMIIGIILKSVD